MIFLPSSPSGPSMLQLSPSFYFLSKTKGNRADCLVTSKEWRKRFPLFCKSFRSLHILFPLSS